MLQLLREQAEGSSPEVRAAALLRIARVEAKFDLTEALRTFEAAVEEIRRRRPSHRKWLAFQARTVAAAIAPDRLEALLAAGEAGLYEPDTLIRVMLEYGHEAAAVSYTLHHDHGPDFPMERVGSVIHVVADPDTRTELLRRAVDAWRRGYLRHIAAGQNFIYLFQHHWALLPRAEAVSVLHEIVEQARDAPEHSAPATYDQGTVTITSAYQQTLFQLLHVLRALDPALAESLVNEYDQLGAAARRFPNGWQTIEEEANANRPTEPGPGGYLFMGSPEDFPYLQSLVDADRDGNFDPPFEYALEKYARDASSNYAPKEFWPSAQEFRSIVHAAARRLGPAASSLLDRIPDLDLRLFAAIELEAALVRLPAFAAVSTITLPRPEMDEETTDRVGGPGIRCPKCGWRPGPHDRWACKCGHIWNTFDTGGVCPACLYQWTETACLRCGEWSPHSDWYAQE